MHLLLALATLLFTACSHEPVKVERSKVYYWISPLEKDKWEVRSLGADPCPSIILDGKPVALTSRFTTEERFPEKVCQAEFKRNQSLAGDFPKLNPDPKRFVIFGDTGCRIKIGKKVQIQACNESDAWPFAKVAEAAARWNPDLVIHVGDYHYRDSDCPADHSECKGSVTGDREGAWKQDFFNPAEPLLKAAPWILVRGNHEDCERAGRGWFHFLAPGPYRECTNFTDPYTVSFPQKDFLIVDSGDDKNIQNSLDRAPTLRKDSWLLTHRPLLTLDSDESSHEKIKFPKVLMKSLSALFAGHVHTVSIDRFKDDRPPEFILGNGGSALAEQGPVDAQKNAAAEATTFYDYGFTTLEDLGAKKWKVTVHDRNGKEIIGCKWNEAKRELKAISCERL